MKHKQKITLENAQAASDAWGLNCGPGALCAALNKTPEEIRPFLGDFEQKRYTNPTLMYGILDRMGVKHETVYRGDTRSGIRSIEPTCNTQSPYLIRIQWGGPWAKEGVPMSARYPHTHWIGLKRDGTIWIFDINAIGNGGWISDVEWVNYLVPWLLREVCPKGDGSWWPTHIIRLDDIQNQ